MITFYTRDISKKEELIRFNQQIYDFNVNKQFENLIQFTEPIQSKLKELNDYLRDNEDKLGTSLEIKKIMD